MSREAPLVLVVGSVNTDMVMHLPHLPSPGETVGGGHISKNPGGKGANQAVAAARLGATVRFIGKVGDDLLGEKAFTNFHGHGIETTGLGRHSQEASGLALIFVGASGENAIGVAPGANMSLMPEDVVANEMLFVGLDVIVGQFEVPQEASMAAFQIAHDRGVKTILNAAPGAPIPESWVPLVDYLVVNQSEAGLIVKATGHASELPMVRIERLLGLGYAEVVLTLGSEGAYLAGVEGCIHVPAFSVTAIDTTGAGDAFVGGLAVALAEGQSGAEAVRFACAAGALATRTVGAQGALPDRMAVTSLLSGKA